MNLDSEQLEVWKGETERQRTEIGGQSLLKEKAARLHPTVTNRDKQGISGAENGEKTENFDGTSGQKSQHGRIHETRESKNMRFIGVKARKKSKGEPGTSSPLERVVHRAGWNGEPFLRSPYPRRYRRGWLCYVIYYVAKHAFE